MRVVLVFLVAVLGFGSFAVAQSVQNDATAAKADELPLIEWYMIDLPPIQNATGVLRGRGYTDWMRWRVIANLDGYRHTLRNANVQRMLHDIRNKENICNPAFLWTAERQEYMIYADPLHVQFPNGAVVMKSRLGSDFKNYVDSTGVLAVADLISDGGGAVVVQSGRSYGSALDRIVATAKEADRLVVVTGNLPVESKLGLLSAGRAAVALLYPYEFAYSLGLGVDTEASPYAFFPVEGSTNYTLNHLACSRSALGEAVIAAANPVIAQERDSYFAAAYRVWLPESLLERHAAHHLDAFQVPLQAQAFVPRIGDDTIAECLLDGGTWVRHTCQSAKD